MRRSSVIKRNFLYASSAVCVLTPFSLFAQTPAAASPDFFENKVRPILANRCFECHTDSALGGLRLDSSAALMKGGDRGVAVVPGDPDHSLIVEKLQGLPGTAVATCGARMPYNLPPICPAAINVLRTWIKNGALEN